MLQDFEKNTGEDDLTHVNEILEGQRLDGHPDPPEKSRKILLNNFENRVMHHHVFNEANSRNLLEAVGFEVLAQEIQPPFHIYLVVRLP